jgi:hypothetical protein
MHETEAHRRVTVAEKSPVTDDVIELILSTTDATRS